MNSSQRSEAIQHFLKEMKVTPKNQILENYLFYFNEKGIVLSEYEVLSFKQTLLFVFEDPNYFVRLHTTTKEDVDSMKKVKNLRRVHTSTAPKEGKIRTKGKNY